MDINYLILVFLLFNIKLYIIFILILLNSKYKSSFIYGSNVIIKSFKLNEPSITSYYNYFKLVKFVKYYYLLS